MQSAYPVFPLGTDSLSLEFPTFRKFGLSVHDHFIPDPRNNYHPHILSHRMLALLSLLLLTVKIAAISLVAITPAAIVEASAITAPTVISLANNARVEGGLSALTNSSVLSKAAQAKANDMLAKQYFAHNTPDGKTPWDFIKAAGYSYVTAGENLAIDFTEAESIQTAWMNSPGHRANIMNKNFQEIGIGISQGMFNGHQTTIVVQMFGAPIAQKVTLPATPTPVKQPTTPATTPAPQVHAATDSPAPTYTAPVVPPASAPTTSVQEEQDFTPVPLPPPASSTQTTPPVIAEQSVQIKSTETSLQGNQLYLTVTASEDATKLLATYGSNSVMLDPAGNNQWYGYIPLASLTAHSNLLVYAYDINGNLTHAQVSQFSSSLNPSLNAQEPESPSVSILGKVVNPGIVEQKVMLIALAALLSCLVLAIAVRRHVQHVGLIANTAFVAMLAAFMFMI